jgi:hypothetical protein
MTMVAISQALASSPKTAIARSVSPARFPCLAASPRRSQKAFYASNPARPVTPRTPRLAGVEAGLDEFCHEVVVGGGDGAEVQPEGALLDTGDDGRVLRAEAGGDCIR